MQSLPPGRDRVAHFTRMLQPFWGADRWRSVTQLASTAIPYAALWYAMLRSLEVSYALTLLLAVPAAGLLMRLFMIQHDCGHGSFFKSRRARDWLGSAIGVLTLVPYHYWRKTHAHHHAHSGDLDFRGLGDVDTLTVREYLALSRIRRLAYRFYRSPIALFVIGPVYLFLIKHRYPWDIPKDWKQAWRSVWWTNACLAALILVMSLMLGWQRFLLVQAPITAIAATLGVWLFYIQHQFEEAYWERHEAWDFYDAALKGSSCLVLPKPLQWMTANIGFHHVHHLSSRIPNYRLQECMGANPDLQDVKRLRIGDTWKLIGLTLWDEDQGRLIGFRELRRLVADGRAPAPAVAASTS